MIFLLSAIRTNSLKSGFKDGIPRLCGEKQFGAPNPDVTQGSPPPMRGKVSIQTDDFDCYRITPAYAGKSARRSGQWRLPWDHPRLCGEKSATTSGGMSGSGSPPPMRGKVPAVQNFVCRYRITPAYAGKSCPMRCVRFLLWDHPRLCGEKVFRYRCKHLVSGSPPPMRGKGRCCTSCSRRVRITPAYAGKSINVTLAGSSCWDHPRLCGEKLPQQPRFCWAAGSPPPMRGKEKHSTKPRTYARITPAYAGKREIAGLHSVLAWDHPRLCGEKWRQLRTVSQYRGSPPPMRGKAQWLKDKVSGFGITPAYAGKRPMFHPALNIF